MRKVHTLRSIPTLLRSVVLLGTLGGAVASAADVVPVARKGSRGPQVEEAFRHLQAHGYFPNAELAREYPGFRPAVAREPARPDVFDDALEAGLQRFQEAQGLPVTGELDAATRALMHRSRCSSPDLYGFTARSAGSGPESFTTVSSWPQTNLTFAFLNSTPDLDAGSSRAAVIGALLRWQAAAPVAFTEVGSGNVDLFVSWQYGDHGDGYPFDANVLAHAFYPACSAPYACSSLSGDVHFNDAYGWTVNGTQYDLRSTALHELGHSLGLGHSPDSGAVMYAYYNGKIDLQPDDLNGIRTLYGTFRDSRTFDASFYLSLHSDLSAAFGGDQGAASRHWIDAGRNEGRMGAPTFDVRDYLARYPDLQAAFGNNYPVAISHWMQSGINEGRQGSVAFSAPYYLAIYPDLRNAFGNNYRAAMEHFLTAGLHEGRRGSPEFDPAYYLAANPDVAAVYGANNFRGGLIHWLQAGRAEGRRGAP
ncbi:matrixin family metalloprotease [Stigmatella aurantiaca]|uniref:Interstitial collagenase (Matrixmetalloproteinase-1) (MMP-1) (Fibroblast collagenase) n=1 Tax=Stigmatella aurantiaca (strain DW4/3-1) TaxID=378806 RepID=Q098Y1_STIAD|nr:matrixin family metalloprotease [Stigmatella aurantiaca]ADO75472.1 Peptidase [Stigmatella aurantiaca DW4/3-1]EAU68263.1 interstitial collagenase (Matrixmetalloproteinase-1) (MMP-1) (Fibroblast collagenase) [Stigmatella aurantiaca DW4/3-1]